ncbi:unnamed protein product [Cylicocyclus nassatus]|uniref:DUF7778 domain-containing protein n=1 Tax=Cylicocyclus nassatus TaxID=53992 RepID=A0AA36MCE1_CYLNA|nr:unnamed protein product [Cylicocyclus nassatus]
MTDNFMNAVYTSHSLTEKIALPQRSTLRVDNENVYMLGDLEVRRHNGLFWHLYHKKTCVLLTSGHFLIYSSPFHGLCVYLPALHNVTHRFSGNEGTGSETKARCDIILCEGHAKLGILIKGHRSLVTAWRRGIVCSHKGLPIAEPHLTDELIWMQPTVNPEASESLICSLANRSLRLNNSMPSLVQTIFATQRKQSWVGCSDPQPRKALTLENIRNMRSSLRHSHSFAATLPRAKHNMMDESECTPIVEHDNHADNSMLSFMSDSGVWSPVHEEPELVVPPKVEQREERASPETKFEEKSISPTRSLQGGVDWRRITIAAKLPLLRADILNFEAAFAVNDDYKEPVFDL